MDEGRLIINDAGRWEIYVDTKRFGYQLTSGSVCEVKVAGHWIQTGIESGPDGYYATTLGIKFYIGQPARFQ